mgnify:CR=1 FL=1
MNTPNHLFYTKEHEWANFKEEIVIIGITDYAQSQLGDVIFIDIPEIENSLKLGDTFGEIEAVKTVSDLYMPISGIITEVNNKLENNPDLINNDPYDSGWIIKVKPTKIEEKDSLMDFLSYERFVR